MNTATIENRGHEWGMEGEGLSHYRNQPKTFFAFERRNRFFPSRTNAGSVRPPLAKLLIGQKRGNKWLGIEARKMSFFYFSHYFKPNSSLSLEFGVGGVVVHETVKEIGKMFFVGTLTDLLYTRNYVGRGSNMRLALEAHTV